MHGSDLPQKFFIAQVYLYETSPSGTKFNCNTDVGCRSIGFSIVVMDKETNSKVFTSELQSCASGQVVQITKLTCNRWYYVSAVFSFPNGSLTTCHLSSMTTVYSGDCPTTVTDEATIIARIGKNKFKALSTKYQVNSIQLFI